MSGDVDSDICSDRDIASALWFSIELSPGDSVFVPLVSFGMDKKSLKIKLWSCSTVGFSMFKVRISGSVGPREGFPSRQSKKAV